MKSENIKNNLIKEYTWYNPYIAQATNENFYKLDNIIIYSEHGILLETCRGWFGSNNDLGDIYINEINLRKKVNFENKENFIIKSASCDYRIETNYTLYIYYKNINCKFIKYTIDSLFLESNFTILNNYRIDGVIGYTREQSDKIGFNKELEENFKKIDIYNFQGNFEEIEKAMKKIKKYHKLYEEAKEQEKNYTLKDYKKMLRVSSDRIDPYYIINSIKQTFNADIEKMEG